MTRQFRRVITGKLSRGESLNKSQRKFVERLRDKASTSVVEAFDREVETKKELRERSKSGGRFSGRGNKRLTETSKKGIQAHKDKQPREVTLGIEDEARLQSREVTFTAGPGVIKKIQDSSKSEVNDGNSKISGNGDRVGIRDNVDKVLSEEEKRIQRLSERIEALQERESRFFNSEGFKRIDRTANVLTQILSVPQRGVIPFEERSRVGQLSTNLLAGTMSLPIFMGGFIPSATEKTLAISEAATIPETRANIPKTLGKAAVETGKIIIQPETIITAGIFGFFGGTGAIRAGRTGLPGSKARQAAKVQKDIQKNLPKEIRGEQFTTQVQGKAVQKSDVIGESTQGSGQIGQTPSTFFSLDTPKQTVSVATGKSPRATETTIALPDGTQVTTVNLKPTTRFGKDGTLIINRKPSGDTSIRILKGDKLLKETRLQTEPTLKFGENVEIFSQDQVISTIGLRSEKTLRQSIARAVGTTKDSATVRGIISTLEKQDLGVRTISPKTTRTRKTLLIDETGKPILDQTRNPTFRTDVTEVTPNTFTFVRDRITQPPFKFTQTKEGALISERPVVSETAQQLRVRQQFIISRDPKADIQIFNVPRPPKKAKTQIQKSEPAVPEVEPPLKVFSTKTAPRTSPADLSKLGEARQRQARLQELGELDPVQVPVRLPSAPKSNLQFLDATQAIRGPRASTSLGVKTSPAIASAVASSLATAQSNQGTNVISLQTPQSSSISGTSNIVSQIGDSAIISEQVSNTRQNVRQLQRQLQIQQQRIIQQTQIRQQTLTPQTTITTTTTKVPEPPPPPPPLIPKISTQSDILNPSTQISRQQAYNVLVKNRTQRRGKKTKKPGFSKANTRPLTRMAALGRGAQIVDEFANRSYTIQKASGKPANTPGLEITWRRLQHKFRQAKRSQNVLVERTRHAIDSRKELQQITFEGQKARRRLAQSNALGIKTSKKKRSRSKVFI